MDAPREIDPFRAIAASVGVDRRILNLADLAPVDASPGVPAQTIPLAILAGTMPQPGCPNWKHQGAAQPLWESYLPLRADAHAAARREPDKAKRAEIILAAGGRERLLIAHHYFDVVAPSPLRKVRERYDIFPDSDADGELRSEALALIADDLVVKFKGESPFPHYASTTLKNRLADRWKKVHGEPPVLERARKRDYFKEYNGKSFQQTRHRIPLHSGGKRRRGRAELDQMLIDEIEDRGGTDLSAAVADQLWKNWRRKERGKWNERALWEYRHRISEAVTMVLTSRERDIVHRRLNGEKFTEIAAEYGKDRKTISTWHDNAIEKVKQRIGINNAEVRRCDFERVVTGEDEAQPQAAGERGGIDLPTR